MLNYIPDLFAEPLMADREREAKAIALAAQAARCRRGLRAGFAWRLARLALLLHREAAVGAGLLRGIEADPAAAEKL